MLHTEGMRNHIILASTALDDICAPDSLFPITLLAALQGLALIVPPTPCLLATAHAALLGSHRGAYGELPDIISFSVMTLSHFAFWYCASILIN